MNIEKELFPECYKMKNENGFLNTLIVDEEIDPFNVSYDGSGIEIDTKDYTHISLSAKHLIFLLDFIDWAEIEFEKEVDKERNNEKI